MWRQLELVADVIAAFSSIGDVDGEDQSFVAQRFHSMHDLFGQLSVPVDVQLEPAVAVWCCSSNLLHGAGGVRAGDVAGVEGLGGCVGKSLL